jgi:hypothetical protein
MALNALFDILDLDKDGELSRSEIHVAAKRLGWHWHEAPILAVLDLLTIMKPISRSTFIAYMNQIEEDPLGPYGQVLLNAPYFSSPTSSGCDLLPTDKRSDLNDNSKKQWDAKPDDSLLLSKDDAALLIIDPQRSFTEGVWKHSIGSYAEDDTKPIQTAFNNCAHLLNENYGRIETMFTRCPFPPDSYDWDDQLAGIIDSKQLYFIKPGNSILFPPTNGFREWVQGCINTGKEILVMGGCTLNSCLRVSSIETKDYFESQGFQVVVDLSLCGARARNYIGSAMYDGFSAVEAAVREMMERGVRVVRRVQWK